VASPGIVRATIVGLILAAGSAIALSAPQPSGSASRGLTTADYARAERFMSWNTTPLVFRNGVSPTWSEIVGLVPEAALFEAAARHVQLRNFSPEMVLERRVRNAIQGGETVSGFIASVASSSPTPGGGSVAAHVGALAASLAQMVAGLTAGRKKYAAVDAEMRDVSLRAAGLVNELSALVSKDAAAYSSVSAAYKLPAEPEEAGARRKEAITHALLGAAEVPLETARACARDGRSAR